MQYITKYMTRNDCYKRQRKFVGGPKGIMVHSTAAPGAMADIWFDKWNKSYAAGEIKSHIVTGKQIGRAHV